MTRDSRAVLRDAAASIRADVDAAADRVAVDAEFLLSVAEWLEAADPSDDDGMDALETARIYLRGRAA